MTIRDDPPPSARGAYERKGRPSVWYEWLAGAVADPGQWYRLPGDWDPTAFSRLVRAAHGTPGRLPRLPPGRWEFRRDDIPLTLRIHIWARVTSEGDDT